MKILKVLFLFLVLTVSANADAFKKGQVWEGHYLCPGVKSAMKLHIKDIQHKTYVDGIFEFNSNGIMGSYRVLGFYQPDTSLVRFETREWIVKPKGFHAIGFVGYINGDTFNGNIKYSRCTKFFSNLVK